jgi:hypothetical protein
LLRPREGKRRKKEEKRRKEKEKWRRINGGPKQLM